MLRCTYNRPEHTLQVQISHYLHRNPITKDMKHSILSDIFIRLAVLLTAAAADPALRAQSLEPFNPYGIFSPSVEAWQMTRYGNLTPSLYTGAMTYSIPLYTYEDPDFTIPISLEYSFDGYRPSQHSGTVGYGWYFNCGGVITREVRGVPDEGTVAPYDPNSLYEATRGWFSTCAEGLNGNQPDSLIWSYHRYVGDSGDPLINLSGIRSYDAFSDIPAYVDTSGLRHRYDLAPDIWHFSFLGHSGNFMMMEDGTFRVYDSDLPEGEIKVEYMNGTNNPMFLKFVLSDGRGYEYVFERGGWSKTYGEGALYVQDDNEVVTSLHLTRINFPNERYVLFTYHSDQCVSSVRSYSTEKHGSASAYVEDSETPVESAITSGPPIRYVTVEENETLLDSVAVFDGSGHWEASVQMEYVAAAENESSAASFLNPHLYVTGYPQQLLRKITVRNERYETVEEIVLSQFQASSGVHKSFLESVTGKRFGTYSFQYELPKGRPLPKNDTWETDHWGFWNGAGAEYLQGHFSEQGTVEVEPGYTIVGPDSTITVVPPVYEERHATHLYDQMLDGVKEASFTHVRTGALIRINYPTGGSTSVEYEGNVCGKRLNTYFSNSFVMLENVSATDPSLTYPAGGVRVSSLTDSDGQGGEYITRFLYQTVSGLPSGILMQMPRYVESVKYDHYGAMCSAYISARGFCNACGVQISRGPHLGYSSVRQVMPDGSYTTFDFVSAAESWARDSRDDNLISPNVPKRALNMYDRIVPYGTPSPTLAPVIDDKSAMRGKPLREVGFAADGTEQYRKEHSYSWYPVTINYIWYNTPLYYRVTHFTAYSLRLTGVAETLHGMTAENHYTYNSRGQKTCETAVHYPHNAGPNSIFAADTLQTSFNYLHETVDTTSLTAALSAASLVRMVDGVPVSLVSENYTYGEWSSDRNPRPTAICRHAPDGSSRTTTISYDGRFRPLRLDFPGGAYINYTWNRNNLESRTDNKTGNTTSYIWKDLVGPTLVTLPAGLKTGYTYDSKNRLHGVSDTRDNTVTLYDYQLTNEQ